MTELATPPSGQALTALTGPHATAEVIQIADWAAELDAAHKLGHALSMSHFLPEGLLKLNKNDWKTKEQVAYDAAIIILAGKSLGLDPLASVQNIFTVRGRPGMYARTMVGIAIAQGHEVIRSEATATSVTIDARRQGQRDWSSFTWDLSRAKQAGYDSNPIYKSDPIAMLTAKAQAEACRVMFPDVLMGMPYSSEDLQLEDLGEKDSGPKTTVRRTTQKATSASAKKDKKEDGSEASPPAAKKTEPAKSASSPAAADGAEKADDPSAPIADATWKEIKDLLKEKHPDRASQPGQWAMEVIGRTVRGSKEFTQGEGDQMLELLISGELPATKEGAES